ncbi:unnamed protein product [Blepharisma stoltei]|uniref:Uncharacterized protein n=1 Tax=Blepharisma stoltei TaxID=1481888 RepID=A0AAU9JKZ1_9CILI|nr:unnamed protein product [Blepharisma stoltei]
MMDDSLNYLEEDSIICINSPTQRSSDIKGSMGLDFNKIQNDKNPPQIFTQNHFHSYSCSTVIPTETHSSLKLPIKTQRQGQVFERLVQDVNARHELKAKIEESNKILENQKVLEFKSKKRISLKEKDDLYNRLVEDENRREKIKREMQAIAEAQELEILKKKKLLTKKEVNVLLDRLHGYHEKKKEWLEAIEKEKIKLEQLKLKELESFTPRKTRDSDLFQRLSIPKSPRSFLESKVRWSLK